MQAVVAAGRLRSGGRRVRGGDCGGGRFGGAIEEESAFAGVLSECGGTSEFGLGLGEAAELVEQVAANRWEQVITLERRLAGEAVDDFESGGGTEGHGNSDGAIELDDW